jgi:hypothetical protein
MTHCRECGTRLPDGADACPKCGAPVGGADRLDGVDPHGAPAWIAWIVVGGILCALFGLGVFLVLRQPTEPSAATEEPVAASTRPSGSAPAKPTGKASPSGRATSRPSSKASGTPTAMAPSSTVEVPGSAPPNNDVDGTQVTFVGPNLVDGDAETAWRLAGDQTGAVITLRFDTEVTVNQVGMVNGWAKTTRSTSGAEYDWYHANRRVLSVDWIIGGRTFPQSFGDTTDMQVLDIPDVRTSDVQVKITSVSAPGTTNPRDYTAISEIAATALR